MTTSWWIEPRDPLVVRDGRPNHGRSESRTRDFPLPSTIAGACRTRLGSGARGFEMRDDTDHDALLSVPLRGPVLAERDTGTLFLARPSDAVLYESTETSAFALRALRPREQDDDVRFDEGLGDLELLHIEQPPEGKPNRSSATYWPWSVMERWLVGALADAQPTPLHALLPNALGALPREARMHVALTSTGTAADGQLFETEGLRFTDAATGRRFALRVEMGELPGRHIAEGTAPLGGERRLVHWASASGTWPGPPAELVNHLGQSTDRVRVRVILASPAIFDGGSLPTEASPLLAPREGLEVRLVAASVDAPIAVSGWSLRDGKPKPSRRAAPAGSTYWLDLKGSASARSAWLDGIWFQNVSCDAQARRDGWGLALVGVA